MRSLFSLVLMSALLIGVTPVNAEEEAKHPSTYPYSDSKKRAEAIKRRAEAAQKRRHPKSETETDTRAQPYARTQRREQTQRRRLDNPYSVKNKPLPALNSPYSTRGRSLQIQRDATGRAQGYSIRRPDGRVQYREFQGRGSKRGLPHAWQ